MKSFLKSALLAAVLSMGTAAYSQVANQAHYLDEVKSELVKKWPNNRTVNVVFHGHSVPSGYSTGGAVETLQAYPHLLRVDLNRLYHTAVINVITTSIGGEQAEQGAKRFKKEVLTTRPDVLFIDYALNDRSIGLERSEKAWRKMIEMTLKSDIKLILMTPTPDLKENILSDDTPLQAHAEMIRGLAAEYKVGLVDSYKAFKDMAKKGVNLRPYMSQNNHPNGKGHQVVGPLITPWFE